MGSTARSLEELARKAFGKSPHADWICSIRFYHCLNYEIPPGNRLEALGGDRKGQYSIRINDQYRICFSWTAQGPDQVEIVDYH